MPSSMICPLESTFCISESYNVYVIGNNNYHNLGNSNDNIHIPKLIKEIYDIQTIDCGLYHVLCLDFNGNVFSFGDNDCGQLGP